ncbi:hypothetical protein [Mycobacterium riyadhense]|uniref:Uncharacterized protein n=1 Tax=Mycobacterium riyadhense TaxID=486698 RepID=A0A653F2U3_9MYCO|nr:hypothetical protein [Mycobacterium riyadhense]VTP03940.1 hypothetical protein BIN_B_05320 [Mycobacterium riyadhense]
MTAAAQNRGPICSFDWCDNSKDGGVCTGEHWTATYTSGTHPSSHSQRLIGCGVSWYEPEDGPHPAVAVHIHSLDHSVDADAFLRLDEAQALMELLDRAISTATAIAELDKWAER